MSVPASTSVTPRGHKYVILMPEGKGNRKKRMENWSTQDAMTLIQIWKDNANALRLTKRNHHVYQKIAGQLLLMGVQRSPQEVKTKIANLTSDYRKEKGRIQFEIGSPSSWKFWDPVHDIIGNLPQIEGGSTGSDGGLRERDDDEECEFPNVEAILGTHVEIDCSPSIDLSRPSDPSLECEVPCPSRRPSQILLPPQLETEDEEYENDAVDEQILPQRLRCRPPRTAAATKDTNCLPANKRKRHYEDQQLKFLWMIFDEHKRMNASTQQSECYMQRLLLEQVNLHRQSLALEERMTRAVEGMCHSLAGEDGESGIEVIARMYNGSGSTLNGNASRWDGL